MKTIYVAIGALLLIGCTKNIDAPVDNEVIKEVETKPGHYSTFTIQKGAHHCDQNPVKPVTTAEMKFMVKFDSSAIYQTVLPENQ